jgi:hypothetical protein
LVRRIRSALLLSPPSHLSLTPITTVTTNTATIMEADCADDIPQSMTNNEEEGEDEFEEEALTEHEEQGLESADSVRRP